MGSLDHLPEGGEGNRFRDRQEEIVEFFDLCARQAAKARVSDEVIEEHRQRPEGPHSDRLARLLRYLRSHPTEWKLAVVRLGPDQYRLCRTVEKRGVEPIVEDQLYSTADEAIHAIFLRRVSELEAS